MTKATPNFWPEEWMQGLIKTKNQMGIMTTELSPPSRAFVEYTKKVNNPVLDIGCAYGAATIPALLNGAKVIACDLDPQHLEILRKSIPEGYSSNLETIVAAFPDELNFGDNSLDAVHISMVLHFMKGEVVLRGLKKCYQWLVPGGKLFVVNMSPYLGLFDWHKVSKIFSERAKAGEKWPGEINIKEVTGSEWTHQLPEFGHFFDVDVMRRAAEDAGFFIEDCFYFCYENVPEYFKTNGKEYVGLIAVKK